MIGSLLLWLVGCGTPEVQFADGFGWDASEGMHLPWAAGSDVVLTVQLNRRLARADDLTVRSVDPAVVEVVDWHVDDDRVLRISAHAVSAGGTTIQLRKGDKEIGSQGVDVRDVAHAGLVPSSVALAPGGGSPVTLFDTPQVVVNGQAWFRVQFFDAGSTPVYGAEVLDVDAPRALHAAVDTSHLGVEGVWVGVSPSDEGVFPVTLRAGDGVEVGGLEVVAVRRPQVAELSLVADSELRAEDGDLLRVVLMASDQSGEPVFGPPVTWSLEGDTVDEPLDLEVFEYVYEGGATQLLEVSLDDDRRASVTIHGDLPDSCGCRVASSPGGLLAGLPLLFVLFRRRREPRP